VHEDYDGVHGMHEEVSLWVCVCDLLYRKKAVRIMVRSGAALMSRNWKGGSLWRKLRKGAG
jgi:hypothetical protein